MTASETTFRKDAGGYESGYDGATVGSDCCTLAHPPRAFAEMFDSILDCSLVVRDLVHERNNAALQGRPYTHERLGQSKALYTCNEIVDVGWR
jgi:hypothetical protein